MGTTYQIHLQAMYTGKQDPYISMAGYPPQHVDMQISHPQV